MCETQRGLKYEMVRKTECDERSLLKQQTPDAEWEGGEGAVLTSEYDATTSCLFSMVALYSDVLTLFHKRERIS